MALEYYNNWNNAHQIRRQSSSFNLSSPDVPKVQAISNSKTGIMSKSEKNLKNRASKTVEDVLSKGQKYMNIFGNQNEEFMTAELGPQVTRSKDFVNPYDAEAAAKTLMEKVSGTTSKPFRDKRMDKTDMSLEEFSVNFLMDREGYQPTGKWDVTAFRAGHGSDTTTKADGTIVEITKGMVVTEEDALRDLKRREAKFRARAKKQSGKSWESYGDATKTALTSYTYNYGSLTETLIKAVKSGDRRKIAEELRARAEDNEGANRNRRNEEASLVESEFNAREYKQAMDERNK